jgi:hypothetical protein
VRGWVVLRIMRRVDGTLIDRMSTLLPWGRPLTNRSKAALNQFVRTLDHEVCHLLSSQEKANGQLINRSSSAVAVAYHPGTVLTSFSKRILGDKAKPSLEKGILTPEQAIEHMTKVMSQVKREGDAWGGKCWDWKGDRVQW